MTRGLNLIPPSYKDRFRLQRVYTHLKNVLVATIFYTIFLGITLLAARFILQQNFNRIVNETTLTTKENRDVEKNISAFNREITAAQTIEKTYRPWGDLLIDLTNLVTDDASLVSLKIDAENNQGIISGEATNRTALLAFKERLAQAPYITSVSLPVTDLLTREKSRFTLTFTVNFE